MIPEGSHVRSVFLDKEWGVLAAPPTKRVYIDCSTIYIETSQAVLEAIKHQHPDESFHDAPVSSGSLSAEKASLTVMIGCSEDDPAWSFLENILGYFGKTIVLCGGPSLDLIAKLCNNYCSGLMAIADAEALNIGMKSGMNPLQLFNIFSTSIAESTMCNKWNPVPGIAPDTPSSYGYQAASRSSLCARTLTWL